MRERARCKSRRQPRKHSRGAVAAEAALVTPLLLLIAFGIVQMVMLVTDNSSLTSLAQQAARSASARVDEGSTIDGVPAFAQRAADDLAAHAAAERSAMRELWIYQSNKNGYPCLTTPTPGTDVNPCGRGGSDKNKSWTCSANCIKFEWSDSDQRFEYAAGSWPSSSVDACAGDQIDSVGAYLSADHSFAKLPLVHRATMTSNAAHPFESLDDGFCNRGEHE